MDNQRQTKDLETKDLETKDLGAVFDAHAKAEFVDRDVVATMGAMSQDPYLTHVPTLAVGTDREEVENFSRNHFVGR